jgi:hypothetical protein
MELKTEKLKLTETYSKESNDYYYSIKSSKRKIHDNRRLRANCKSAASEKV